MKIIIYETENCAECPWNHEQMYDRCCKHPDMTRELYNEWTEWYKDNLDIGGMPIGIFPKCLLPGADAQSVT